MRLRLQRNLLAAIALLLGVGWLGGARAQEQVPRPKIGLVLSGGGALGLAHVGVLRVLEQMRIPVDYIAGTSMGSIVGAAYASGMTPDEMERRLREIDWERVFRDAPPRSEQSVLRKQLDAAGLWGLEFGVSRGLPFLPKGAIAGQQLLATLRSFVQEPPGGDFDRLPIPFRAVATDIETGEMVVLAKGDLARAMRASMSVPGIISPEEIEGRILLDGGLVRNVPVDVVRAMGAEIVIVVNLGSPLLKRDELGSVLGVSVQMIHILTMQNVRRSLAEITPRDVLLEPDLAGFSAVSFNQAQEIVPRGEVAARNQIAALSRLTLAPEAYESFRLAQTGRLVAPAPAQQMIVDNSRLKSVNPAVVEAAIRTIDGRIPGDDALDANVARLYGRGDLERIDYFFADRDGVRTLMVETREPPRGPDYLRAGLALSTDSEGNGRFSLQLFYDRTWLNALGGEWRNRLQVGFNPSIVSELYQPLDLRGWLFVAPRIEASERVLDIYVGSNRVAQYQVRQVGVGFDVGANFEKWGEIRAGVYRGTASATPSVAIPQFRSAEADVANVNVRALYDQFDNVNFPTRGSRVAATVVRSIQALGAGTEYLRADVDASQAFGRRADSVLLGVRGGKAFSGELTFYDLYSLGGLFNLSGYPIGSLVGESFVMGRAVYYRRLDRIPALADGLFWGGSLEAGNVYSQVSGDRDGRGLRFSGSLFLAADTALGPMYLAWGHAGTGQDAIYLMLGRP
jgi:NTE family protein